MDDLRFHRLGWALVCLVMSSVIFVVDAQIPTEIAISPLYLLPVALVAWYSGRSAALTMAVVSGAQWIGAEILADVNYSSGFVYVWNTAMRVGTFALVAVLVARIRKTNDDLRSLARIDPVTGALNSRAFVEGLEREIERARRNQRAMTLVYIDLDHFKALNDRFGHVVGDTALGVVGDELVRHTRRADIAARVGGDEFAVLLVDVAADLVSDAICRLQQGLLAAMASRRWPVTFSIGAVTFTSPPESSEEALRAADEAMYSVKRGTKNAVRHETRGGAMSRLPVQPGA